MTNQTSNSGTTGTTTGTTTNTAQQLTVHAGHVGKIQKMVLDGSSWKAGDILAYANLNHSGFDIRVGGKQADLNTPVTDGQTVLLVRPVVGNMTTAS